jgi:hypothetical protein
MDETTAMNEYQQAVAEFARLRQRFVQIAADLPAGDDSSPGWVRGLPALRAAIECTVIDRLDPALGTLRAAVRARPARKALRRSPEPRS